MQNRVQRIARAKLLEEKLIREARTNLLKFTFATMPDFKPAPFHYKFYEILNRFAHGEIKKLAVFMPPQHGKSEGSTRRLPTFMLGLNPDLRMAIVSYGADYARKFNRETQRIIDSPEYRRIFPCTTLNSRNVRNLSGGHIRTSDEYEIVGHKGSVRTVGIGGALTGMSADVLFMDDTYKDSEAAESPVGRRHVQEWHDSVGSTRLHNGSQQLMTMTRWHQDDLAGVQLQKDGIYSQDNPEGWVVVTFPAIKETPPTEYDPREIGEALWPERHSLARIEKKRRDTPRVFRSLYQQDPKPAEGMLYGSIWETYDRLPATVKKANYTDTADKGNDFLCSICYEIGVDGFCYVTDVLFTQEPMSVTEGAVSSMLMRNDTRVCMIESNNGGEGFGRAVGKITPLVKIETLHQSKNKESRILTNAPTVLKQIRFPSDWKLRWGAFYENITNYLAVFCANVHDDGADTLTGIIEKEYGKKQYTGGVTKLTPQPREFADF